MGRKHDVNLRLTATDAGMLDAWLRAGMGPQQMIQKMRQLEGQMKKTRSGGGAMAAGFSRDLGKAAMNLVGIGSAMQGVYTFAAMVNKEIEKMHAVQASAFDRQATFQQTMSKMRMQFPAHSSDMPFDAVRKAILEDRSGVPKADLAQTVLSSISADIGTPISERVSNALEVTRGFKHYSTEERASLAEALANLRSAYGGTTKEQLGFISTALPAARATKLKYFADNFVGGLVDASQFGVTQQQATQQMLAIGAASNDPEFATTRTNYIKLLRQMQEMGGALGYEGNPAEIVDQIRRDPSEKGVAARKHLLGAFLDKSREEALLAGEAFDEDKVTEFLKASGGKRNNLRAGLRQRERTFAAIAGMLQPIAPGDDLSERNRRDPQRLAEEAAKEVVYGAQAQAEYERKVKANLGDEGNISQNLKETRERYKQDVEYDAAFGVAGARRQFLSDISAAPGAMWATTGLEQFFNDHIRMSGVKEDPLEGLRDLRRWIAMSGQATVRMGSEQQAAWTPEGLRKWADKPNQPHERRVYGKAIANALQDVDEIIRFVEETRAAGEVAPWREIVEDLKFKKPGEAPAKPELDDQAMRGPIKVIVQSPHGAPIPRRPQTDFLKDDLAWG